MKSASVGVALLELAWRFRGKNIAFYGVDIEEKPELSSPERIVAFAREHGIIPEQQTDLLNIPNLYFYDASTLAFNDESMDFIYSAVTIRFMRKKLSSSRMWLEYCVREEKHCSILRVELVLSAYSNMRSTYTYALYQPVNIEI